MISTKSRVKLGTRGKKIYHYFDYNAHIILYSNTSLYDYATIVLLIMDSGSKLVEVSVQNHGYAWAV